MDIERADFPMENGDFPELCEFTRGILTGKIDGLGMVQMALFYQHYLSPHHSIQSPVVTTSHSPYIISWGENNAINQPCLEMVNILPMYLW